MNNKQKLLTATAITGTIVSASAFTVFDYAICRRKKQPDVRKKEKWKPYLDYVLKEQEWLKEHQEQVPACPKASTSCWAMARTS